MRLEILVGALVLAGGLAAQPARFEVAVIHPSAAAPGAGSSFESFEGGRIRITNEPVKLLVRVAFRLQDSQIAGGPGWLDTDRYDIEAKTGQPGKIAPDEMSALFESLLADRFQLKFHHETRELPVLALVAAKNGVKLKPAADGEGTSSNTSNQGKGTSRLKAVATNMPLLAAYIGNRLGRLVVDRTGLSGSYDFSLEWAPDEASDSAAPSLVTALREQLGLRLESQKAPVEVLVIDRLQRPSEN